MLVERRTLATEPPGPMTATAPDGIQTRELSYEQVGPGRWQALLEGAEEGLWRFSDGTLSAVAAVGPPSPAEYTSPLATGEVLAPLVEASGGRVAWLNDGVPEIRLVANGRRAYSRRWIAFHCMAWNKPAMPTRLYTMRLSMLASPKSVATKSNWNKPTNPQLAAPTTTRIAAKTSKFFITISPCSFYLANVFKTQAACLLVHLTRCGLVRFVQRVPHHACAL